MTNYIVRSTLNMIAANGARGFSMPKAALASGIALGHLTYYFPKRALLEAAVADEFFKDVVAAVEKSVTDSERLRSFMLYFHVAKALRDGAPAAEGSFGRSARPVPCRVPGPDDRRADGNGSI